MSLPPEVVVAAADHQGNFVLISRVSSAAFSAGLTTRDIVGKKIWEFTHEHSLEKFQQAFWRCLSSGEPEAVEATSEIEGKQERWQCLLYPVSAPASVVVIAKKLLEPLKVPLIADELLLLQMYADDLTVDEAADAFQVSRSTIYGRLAAIRRKLQVRTEHGMMIEAARLGLIEV